MNAPRNLKLTIQYDGTDFHGWQRQHGVRTVQGVLEEVLAGLLRCDVGLHGASRTDRGVHAEGQVASLSCRSPIPTDRMCSAINGCLPADVRVTEVVEAVPEFHARFAAIGKHYRYTIERLRVASPLRRRYALHCPYPLDGAAMREAAALFVGEHDYSSFQCATDQVPESAVRHVYAVRVNAGDELLSVDVWGRSFLYKMVRTMVGTILEVGRGRSLPSCVPEILASRDRRRAGPTAAAHGLSLVAVFYDRETLASDAMESDVKAM